MFFYINPGILNFPNCCACAESTFLKASLTQVKMPEKLAELESLQELHKDVVKIKDMKTYQAGMKL